MKKIHRIVAIHNKFSSIPVTTFYFDNYEDLKKVSKELFENNFRIKFKLDKSSLTFEQIKLLFKLDPLLQESHKGMKDCKNKSELILRYEECKNA